MLTSETVINEFLKTTHNKLRLWIMKRKK